MFSILFNVCNLRKISIIFTADDAVSEETYVKRPANKSVKNIPPPPAPAVPFRGDPSPPRAPAKVNRHQQGMFICQILTKYLNDHQIEKSYYCIVMLCLIAVICFFFCNIDRKNN